MERTIFEENKSNVLNFSLDDFNDSDDIYIKKKSNKAEIDEYTEQIRLDHLFNTVWKDKSPIKLGDVLYSDFEKDEYGRLLNLGTKKGLPIGVCCIMPGFLPDKEVRFVSYIDIFSDIPFDTNIKLIKQLKCYNQLAKNIVEGSIYSNASYFNLYNSEISNPYVGNKINPSWLNSKYGLSDFCGWKNTEIIAKQTNNNSAANICYNYQTKNTNKGDWYLPTIAELAILYAKYSDIRQYLFSDIINSQLTHYWSSTQFDKEYAYAFYDGNLRYYNKDMTNFAALPFFHIQLSSKFKKRK